MRAKRRLATLRQAGANRRRDNIPIADLPETLAGYADLVYGLRSLSVEDRTKRIRALACSDLYYLLRYVLGREDMEHPWLFARCREIQGAPDGYLDLWGREHRKSTIITYGLTIQDILNNPNVTIGIFSHTRPIAKGFLRQIKREFESNTILRAVFPDIFWPNPQHDAPKWSEDDGIIVKRSSNPKEATIEAWGLVDGMPTGKHYDIMVYDDVVTDRSVTNPDMIKKTTDAWALSLNLGTANGEVRTIGTRYHFNDTYRVMMERGTVTPRIHPATEDGEVGGKPVFFSAEELAKKRRDQGPYIFSCQQLQNPVADRAMGFDVEWLKRWPGMDTARLNLYILVDPASKKKAGSDYTTMQVIGLGEDNNYYWVAGIRDRLNLTERGEALIRLHRQYSPVKVGYEEYGLQADIEFVEFLQARENYRFTITPVGGRISKPERIRRMVPIMEQGRWYMPAKHQIQTLEGVTVNVVAEFINELESFPVGTHDDLIDGAARILDIGAEFPIQTRRRTISATPAAESDYDVLHT